MLVKGDVMRKLPVVPVVVGVAALVFAVSLAFAPVRGLAAEMLQVFRVQKVQTISISPEDVDRISQALEKGSGDIDLSSLGKMSVDGSMESSEVTLAEAREAVDFPVELPESIESTPQLMLQRGATITLELDVDKTNELLTTYGATHLLPVSVDGKPFTIRLRPTLMAMYPDPKAQGGEPLAFVAQGNGPELVLPRGVDPLALREVLLNLPMLPDNLRRQLAGVNDWQHTLLIPNVDGTSRDITIAGRQAVLVEPKRGEGFSLTGVLWNDDDVIRAVGGTDRDKVMTIATELAR